MHHVERYSHALRPVEPLLLVQEISHRVINEYAQAIAGIQLAARHVASSEARAALTMAATRLVSFAEAHRALQAPQIREPSDLAEYLHRMCSAMTLASLEERGVRLKLTAESIMLEAERCWRVGLIIAELITNGTRHGLRNGPGNIRVEMEVGAHETICRVVDDGCGAGPVRFGRGFDVVTGLASDIGGVVGWCFGPDGTSAELIFPNVVERGA